MKPHIIYVPGILDDIGYVQGALVKLWRLRGVQSDIHSMPWIGKAEYAVKQRRLESVIDSIAASGRPVYLIGASAGGSAVLNAYIADPTRISGVALICPKVNNSKNVGSKITSKNPSFIQSLELLEGNLQSLHDQDKIKIINHLSPRDGLIPHEDSKIPGVVEHALPHLRHNAAILYALTFGFSKILHELRRINRAA